MWDPSPHKACEACDVVLCLFVPCTKQSTAHRHDSLEKHLLTRTPTPPMYPPVRSKKTTISMVLSSAKQQTEKKIHFSSSLAPSTYPAHRKKHHVLLLLHTTRLHRGRHKAGIVGRTRKEEGETQPLYHPPPPPFMHWGMGAAPLSDSSKLNL